MCHLNMLNAFCICLGTKQCVHLIWIMNVIIIQHYGVKIDGINIDSALGQNCEYSVTIPLRNIKRWLVFESNDFYKVHSKAFQIEKFKSSGSLLNKISRETSRNRLQIRIFLVQRSSIKLYNRIAISK